MDEERLRTSLLPWSHVLLQESASFFASPWKIEEGQYMHKCFLKTNFYARWEYPPDIQDSICSSCFLPRIIILWIENITNEELMCRPYEDECFRKQSTIVTSPSHWYQILQEDLTIIMFIHQHYDLHHATCP